MLMFQPLVKFAEFSGRARRSEYWLFTLFIFLATMGLFIVAAGASASSDGGAGAGAGVIVLGVLFMLAMFIPSLAVTFRRLHDIDKPAAWVLISLVPVVGPVVMLIFSLIDGTPGPNRYGPDPKNRAPVPTYVAPVVTEVHHHHHAAASPSSVD